MSWKVPAVLSLLGAILALAIALSPAPQEPAVAPGPDSVAQTSSADAQKPRTPSPAPPASVFPPYAPASYPSPPPPAAKPPAAPPPATTRPPRTQLAADGERPIVPKDAPTREGARLAQEAETLLKQKKTQAAVDKYLKAADVEEKAGHVHWAEFYARHAADILRSATLGTKR